MYAASHIHVCFAPHGNVSFADFKVSPWRFVPGNFTLPHGISNSSVTKQLCLSQSANTCCFFPSDVLRDTSFILLRHRRLFSLTDSHTSRVGMVTVTRLTSGMCGINRGVAVELPLYHNIDGRSTRKRTMYGVLRIILFDYYMVCFMY